MHIDTTHAAHSLGAQPDTSPESLSANVRRDVSQTRGHATLGLLAPRTARGNNPFFGGHTRHHVGIGRSDRSLAGQGGQIFDLKLAALERERDSAEPLSANGLSNIQMSRVRYVAQQLRGRCVVSPTPGAPQSPMPDVWRCLHAVDAVRSKLAPEQRTRVASELSESIEHSGHSEIDKRLLLGAVIELTAPEGKTLADFVKDRAFKGLFLDHLTMVDEGEIEPSARVFDSILVSLAASTFDYDPAGRTLLWEGASRLFAGPSEAERREKLRQVIFTFPNAVKEGEARLETMSDFAMALAGLDVWETE